MYWDNEQCLRVITLGLISCLSDSKVSVCTGIMCSVLGSSRKDLSHVSRQKGECVNWDNEQRLRVFM